MERSEWLAIIIGEANRFVGEHEAALRRALERDGSVEALGAQIDSHVRGLMLQTGDLWDLVRHSNLREPDPALWKSADNWPGVVVSVAFACFAHDLTQNVEAILKGKLPRMDPDQFACRKERGAGHKKS